MATDRVTAGKKVGFWGRLKRLALTDVGALVRGLNAADVEAVERLMLESDFGLPATADLTDWLDAQIRKGGLKTEADLKRALAEDKARTNVLQISELGLVEMTRKRVRQDLRSLLTMACPACSGTGVTKTDATLAAEVLRAVQAKAAADPRRELVIRVHADLAAYLEAEVRDALERLAATLDRKITVQAVTGHVHRDEFEVLLR